MQVHYKLLSGGGWVLLFDEAAGDANERYAPDFQDSVFKPSGYGAASQPRFGMANTSAGLPFKWNSVYASDAAAATSISTIRTALKSAKVHLRITVGATVHYYPNAVLERSTHEVQGRSATHSVQFSADDITTVDPS